SMRNVVLPRVDDAGGAVLEKHGIASPRVLDELGPVRRGDRTHETFEVGHSCSPCGSARAAVLRPARSLGDGEHRRAQLRRPGLSALAESAGSLSPALLKNAASTGDLARRSAAASPTGRRFQRSPRPPPSGEPSRRDRGWATDAL